MDEVNIFFFLWILVGLFCFVNIVRIIRREDLLYKNREREIIEKGNRKFD